MKDLHNKIFANLTVIGIYEIKKYKSARNEQTKYYWVCECKCGNTKIIRGEHITSGRTISCGCLAKSNAATHGMYRTPEYRSWIYMRTRLNSKEPHKMKYYQNVDIQKTWDDFKVFLKDMGTKPTLKHELDRIDPFLPYCKENCRWATRSEQMQNTKRSYKNLVVK